MPCSLVNALHSRCMGVQRTYHLNGCACVVCRAGVQQTFEVMRDALNKTGRPIVYAIDDWGVTNPWEYGISVRISSE